MWSRKCVVSRERGKLSELLRRPVFISSTFIRLSNNKSKNESRGDMLDIVRISVLSGLKTHSV